MPLFTGTSFRGDEPAPVIPGAVVAPIMFSVNKIACGDPQRGALEMPLEAFVAEKWPIPAIESQCLCFSA